MTPRTASLMLATAIAAFKPWTRTSEEAYGFASRIQEAGEPWPDGFVPIDAAEAARHYFNLLRQPSASPPLEDEPVPMSRERAAELYRTHLKNPGAAPTAESR